MKKESHSKPVKKQRWSREIRDSCQARLWAASTFVFHHDVQSYSLRYASKLAASTMICRALQNQSDCTNMHPCFEQNRCGGQCAIGQSVSVSSSNRLLQLLFQDPSFYWLFYVISGRRMQRFLLGLPEQVALHAHQLARSFCSSTLQRSLLSRKTRKCHGACCHACRVEADTECLLPNLPVPLGCADAVRARCRIY